MLDSRLERGIAVLQAVDPDNASTLLARFEASCPELCRFAVEFGYGDVMSRQGLDLRIRELLNVAMLGAMGTAPLQLEMHIKSALHVGASKEELAEVILQMAAYAGFPHAFNALIALDKVLNAVVERRATVEK